jgi:hypothetical protein
MKTHASILICSALLLVLSLGLGTVSSVQAGAAGPVPQATPAGIPTITRSSPPPPGRSVKNNAWAWHNGLIQWSTITNCISIINGDPYTESGAGTYVGYYGDPTNGLPTANTVYYVDVVVEAVGNACAGQYAYVTIGLPSNTSLAISTTNPVYCYYNENPATCPQTLPASPYNSGMYAIPSARSDKTWPLPQGYPWEFQIPLTSTTTLSGSNFQAKVWVIDGNSSPWLNPTVGVYVYAPPVQAPGAFAKSSPANGATGQSTYSTNLSWGTSSGATSYEYCIDTSNNNTCNAYWVSTGTATSADPGILSSNSTYYWQVRAVNSGGSTYANGSSTAWWSFNTFLPLPGAFNKSGPGNGATGQPTSLSLSWGASSGASSYEYCLDTINNNACDNSWVSTGSATSKALSGLTNGTPYYWQVRANNATGSTYADGSSTAWWSFTTAMALPAAFNKASPANAATGQTTSPSLSWGASSGASSYAYCLDTINNNLCDSSWVSTGTATSKALSGLAHGVHYYWQVLAENGGGYTFANGGSTASWSFSTLPLPGAFNKASPANAATKQSSSPTLKWGASSGATSYQYCIDTSNNNTCNTAWISTGAVTGKALSGLAHGVHYYWQVRAKNAAGYRYANGASTAWWSFTTLALPGAFNKTTPANGASNQATNPTLKWAASSGATSYQYCIDTSNNNTCNTAWVSAGTATSKALSGLAHGAHYYWQVRAKNAAGYKYANGVSTAWWSFSVH